MTAISQALGSGLSKLWSNQKIRFLFVGGCNTAFGFGSFSTAYYFFHETVPLVVITILTNIVAVTFAFALYKLIVFQTRGNLLREYFRFWGVYGVSIAISFGLFLMLVQALGMNPYIAQAATIGVTTIGSFVGHKLFSFRAS